jgi:hypothetical protein
VVEQRGRGMGREGCGADKIEIEIGIDVGHEDTAGG